MKALLLCGGEGTRLRPFTHFIPKQLFPLANKPILFYILEYIAASPIREVVMVVGHTQDQIKEALGSGERWGLKIEYIHQPQPLGLAHAVLVAKEALGSEAFMMYLGDNLLAEPLSLFIEDFLQKNAEERLDGMLLVHRVENPWEFGVAEVEGEKVVKVVEKPKTPKSDLALVGIYFFSPEIHRSIQRISPSDRGELEITDAIQDLIDRDRPVGYRSLEGWWKDTGSPGELLNAQELILTVMKEEIQGQIINSHLSGEVSIGKGSVIENCRIKGPICIGGDCLIKDSHLGPFLSIGGQTKISRSELKNSILLSGCRIEGISLRRSILGENNFVQATKLQTLQEKNTPLSLLLGSDSVVELNPKPEQT